MYGKNFFKFHLIDFFPKTKNFQLYAVLPVFAISWFLFPNFLPNFYCTC